MVMEKLISHKIKLLLKEIYNFRSQVAHNGVLKGDERKIKKIRDDFPEYSNLAEKIIAQVIHQSNPDWSQLWDSPGL